MIGHDRRLAACYSSLDGPVVSEGADVVKDDS